jgi:hypothetical protein
VYDNFKITFSIENTGTTTMNNVNVQIPIPSFLSIKSMSGCALNTTQGVQQVYFNINLAKKSSKSCSIILSSSIAHTFELASRMSYFDGATTQIYYDYTLPITTKHPLDFSWTFLEGYVANKTNVSLIVHNNIRDPIAFTAILYPPSITPIAKNTDFTIKQINGSTVYTYNGLSKNTQDIDLWYFYTTKTNGTLNWYTQFNYSYKSNQVLTDVTLWQVNISSVENDSVDVVAPLNETLNTTITIDDTDISSLQSTQVYADVTSGFNKTINLDKIRLYINDILHTTITNRTLQRLQTFRLPFIFNATTSGTISFKLVVDYTANASNNTQSAVKTLVVSALTNPTFTKNVSSTTAYVGDAVGVKVSAANDNNVTLSNIKVSEEIPLNNTYTIGVTNRDLSIRADTTVEVLSYTVYFLKEGTYQLITRAANTTIESTVTVAAKNASLQLESTDAEDVLLNSLLYQTYSITNIGTLPRRVDGIFIPKSNVPYTIIRTYSSELLPNQSAEFVVAYHVINTSLPPIQILSSSNGVSEIIEYTSANVSFSSQTYASPLIAVQKTTILNTTTNYEYLIQNTGDLNTTVTLGSRIFNLSAKSQEHFNISQNVSEYSYSFLGIEFTAIISNQQMRDERVVQVKSPLNDTIVQPNLTIDVPQAQTNTTAVENPPQTQFIWIYVAIIAAIALISASAFFMRRKRSDPSYELKKDGILNYQKTTPVKFIKPTISDPLSRQVNDSRSHLDLLRQRFKKE